MAAVNSLNNELPEPGCGDERETEVESAAFQVALDEYRAWVAAGRPGAVSHEQAVAELLGPPGT
jgi:hypothetical protein